MKEREREGEGRESNEKPITCVRKEWNKGSGGKWRGRKCIRKTEGKGKKERVEGGRVREKNSKTSNQRV